MVRGVLWRKWEGCEDGAEDDYDEEDHMEWWRWRLTFGMVAYPKGWGWGW
jgi:hypothetical protein